jgi:hypothetical protein
MKYAVYSDRPPNEPDPEPTTRRFGGPIPPSRPAQQLSREAQMTVRTVTPADGSLYLTIAWDSGTAILQDGQILDVPPGSVLENTIGVPNLTPLTGQELASNVNGSGGQVSN